MAKSRTPISSEFHSGLSLHTPGADEPFGNREPDTITRERYASILGLYKSLSEDDVEQLEIAGPCDIHDEECCGDGLYWKQPVRSEEE